MEYVVKNLNNTVMRYDPHQDMNCNPKVHQGICSTLLQLRQDIHNRGVLYMQERKRRLKELFITEFLQEDQELRQVDRGYIDTQP